jgi:hypothetical protein
MGLKLGDTSPLAAAVTGEGFASNLGTLSYMNADRVKKEKEAEEAERKKQSGMKKGGKVNKYAKGGDVQSESSKLDQKNAKMDKAQEEGYKRYQKQEADEARENAESRNIGKRLKDTALKAVDTVVTPIANKVHDANEYLSKKSEGVLSQKQREAMFGNPSKDREDWKKSSEKMTKDSYKKGGKVSSASSRGDGIATKGKTRGRIV